MKIEIEFQGTHEASLTIDGKTMTVVSKPGETRLKGITAKSMENTLGGIVADHLYGKIADIQQAWAEATEHDPDSETWDTLSEEAAEAAAERLW